MTSIIETHFGEDIEILVDRLGIDSCTEQFCSVRQASN